MQNRLTRLLFLAAQVVEKVDELIRSSPKRSVAEQADADKWRGNYEAAEETITRLQLELSSVNTACDWLNEKTAGLELKLAQQAATASAALATVDTQRRTIEQLRARLPEQEPVGVHGAELEAGKVAG